MADDVIADLTSVVDISIDSLRRQAASYRTTVRWITEQAEKIEALAKHVDALAVRLEQSLGLTIDQIREDERTQ